MKLLLMTFMASITMNAEPINYHKFLRALALVETRNYPFAVGAHGERTKYQITKAVWEKYNWWVDFDRAGWHQVEATDVAVSYIKDIELIAKPATVEELAARWNCGPYRKTIPKSSIEFGKRVGNLYWRQFHAK